MMKKRRKLKLVATALVVAVALAVLAVSLASCGGGSGSSKSSTTTKLPPGVNDSNVAGNSSSSTTSNSSQPAENGEGETAQDQGQATTETSPNRTVDLAGARFTVVSATRPDSNKSVVSSGGREVAGDYLEVELTAQNVGTDLIDLSDYSFRLTSPGIAADTYSDYYGETGTYGAYVDENEISASLLSYTDLSTVTYLMKIGESVDKVFVFFDLNPENVAKNAGVTKDNTTLAIRKIGGSDYGDEVTVPLAGYAD
jgi:hypothetical protein